MEATVSSVPHFFHLQVAILHSFLSHSLAVLLMTPVYFKYVADTSRDAAGLQWELVWSA